MTNNRHRGQRLGYLEYHSDVLQDRIEELDGKLHTIRQNHSGKEKKLKERSALLDFRQDVKNRAEKISRQVNGVKEHEEKETIEVSNRQRDSAYSVHQEDERCTEVADSPFSTGNELVSDE